MRKKVILVTGANGEVGHGLIKQLAEMEHTDILALDVQKLDESLQPLVKTTIDGDILDNILLARLMSEYEISTVFHLAALLSTRAEFTPEAAHRVNVEGTINLLHLAIEQSRWHGREVKFIFPSSIAVYGVPDLATKNNSGPVNEEEYNHPITMYGCNKLYCENLGRYYANHYRQLAATPELHGVDFRAIRFPGLISADTLPTGGTSDYAPEMIHAAAQGETYACFVRPDTIIPFMAMPDAVKSLLLLNDAPKEALSRHVYNVTSFSLTAEEIEKMIRQDIPGAEINYQPDEKRQKIVDSWPAEIEDETARQDWGWVPDYDATQAFTDYLIPTISQRYPT